jgi:hypothetical protein
MHDVANYLGVDLPSSAKARRLTLCVMSEDFETEKCSRKSFGDETSFTHLCTGEDGSKIAAVKRGDWNNADFLLYKLKGKHVYLSSISGITESPFSTYGFREGRLTLENWSENKITIPVVPPNHCHIT